MGFVCFGVEGGIDSPVTRLRRLNRFARPQLARPENEKTPQGGLFIFWRCSEPLAEDPLWPFLSLFRAAAAIFLIVDFNCPDITKEARRPENTQLISVQWTNAESLLSKPYRNAVMVAITEAK